MRLILASASPRRQSLLRDAGYDFTIHPADIDEENYPSALSPPEIAEYLASAKAEHIAAQHPADVTLGSDTVVYLGTQLLGKPTGANHARHMLSTLSGSTHNVVTGIACYPSRFNISALVKSVPPPFKCADSPGRNRALHRRGPMAGKGRRLRHSG